MNEPIIFLDFDGVIRVPPSWDGIFADFGEEDFCKERIRLLAKLAKQERAKIVVSSDWRTGSNLEEIKGYLGEELSQHLHEDWATPIKGWRWKEVSTWLDNHPEVWNYAILEDHAPHFEGCPDGMRRRLILCNNRHGMVGETFVKLWRKIRIDSPFIWMGGSIVSVPPDNEL